MLEVCVREGAVEAVDVGKNEVGVDVDGWRPAADGPGLDRRVDGLVRGRTRRVAFPEAAVTIERAGDRRWRQFDDRAGRAELPGGPAVLKVEMSIIVYLGLAAPCVIEQSPDDGSIAVEFERPAPVTLGFRSRIDRPRETVTVPPTLEGARTAIQWQAAGLAADTPDKSYPSKRLHPPAVAFGERTAVPEAVRTAGVTSDVTIEVPESLAALFVTAPLSCYLQAELELAPVAAVRLTAPALDRPLWLGRKAPLERDIAALLARAFYLDCLVRDAGPYGVDLREAELLDELGLDPVALYGRPQGDRLAAYLGADYSRVAGRLPDWHLSTVVEPAIESVPTLPYLLSRLSLIQRPDPVAMGRRSLVAESVEDSYVASSREWGSPPRYDLVRNRLRLGELQGWLAEGTPVGAFRATQSAFEHRVGYHERSEGPRRVVVVINDEAMLEEREAVERIYRSRSAELAIDVRVEESLTRAGLREVFASPVDFLHYVGHCDADGLRCADGSVSTADLEGTEVQTFFLNACGSFEQGLALVRRGSVAGAVTLADVLNREASRVGMTFARLVMHGFSVSRALRLASRQSLTNRFYGVVGDGTHRLAQGEDAFPAELTAEAVSADEFAVRFEFPALNVPGGIAKPRHPRAAPFVLRGCPAEAVLDRAAFVAFLRTVEVPVILANEFHWSTDLARQLADGADTAAAASRP
ncbi:MAG: hypothetical protein U5J98_08610 [Halobacteriales archaeon]|nr:hypothetical protein [Halobacteriales archaeon]